MIAESASTDAESGRMTGTGSQQHSRKGCEGAEGGFEGVSVFGGSAWWQQLRTFSATGVALCRQQPSLAGAAAVAR
jgi:hypothetical protein